MSSGTLLLFPFPLSSQGQDVCAFHFHHLFSKNTMQNRVTITGSWLANEVRTVFQEVLKHLWSKTRESSNYMQVLFLFVFSGCCINKMPRALENGHMLLVCERQRVKPCEKRPAVSTCQAVVVKPMVASQGKKRLPPVPNFPPEPSYQKGKV